MTVEILFRGNDPRDKVYKATCRGCNSELRFTGHDAIFRADPAELDMLHLCCPVCNRLVVVEA